MDIKKLLGAVETESKIESDKLSEDDSFLIESLETFEYSTEETLRMVKDFKNDLQDVHNIEHSIIKNIEEVEERLLFNVYETEQEIKQISNEIYNLRGLVELLLYINFAGFLGFLIFQFI